jgi:hypothetical protein
MKMNEKGGAREKEKSLNKPLTGHSRFQRFFTSHFLSCAAVNAVIRG